MGWLRKVLGPRRDGGLPAEHHAPPPSPELVRARIRHRKLLERADISIRDAMAHADEVFGVPETYRGPERRAHPR